MSDNEVVLGIFFLVIVIGFVILIFFLAKNRSSLLENNLKITSNEIWSNISEQTVKLNFLKSNLLFGIWQDVSATSLCMIVKDINDQIVGRIICPMASRKRTITIDDKYFLVEFPLTWNHTAILYTLNKERIVAKYTKRSLFGSHEYEVFGFGLIKRSNFSFKRSFNYQLNKKMIGVSQFISSNKNIGKLIILPEEIPLEVRLFILSL